VASVHTRAATGAALLLLQVSTTHADELSLPPSWTGISSVADFDQAEAAYLASADRAIARISAVKAPFTIENTLRPFDEAVRELNSAANLANVTLNLHPDQVFRDHGTEALRKASDAQTALNLNRTVYQALSRLDLSKADAPTHYYVKRQMLEFRLAGVNKPLAVRKELKRLNDALTTDQIKFERTISDDQSSVEVTSAAELDGLPQDFIERHKPGADGRIRLSTNYTDVFPTLDFANNAALRKRMYEAFNNRAYPTNSEVLRDMMRLRYRIAQLIGYRTWADFNAADKMIGNAAGIEKFIDELGAAARPALEREYVALLAVARTADPSMTVVQPYDVYYLQEKLKRSQYQFDSQAVRDYLPYDELKEGVMSTAAKLFHVEFRPEQGVAVWDPSVETWTVVEDGRIVGRFYLDMHPRKGKYAHAAEQALRDGVRGVQLPEAVLMCNFPAPAQGDPGLMEFDDAVTFFHEFGHLMHHILGGQQRWAGISGITMEGDFVEAPSQMLERWMRSPQVLQSFARHYKTGEVIPTEMIERMNRADAYGRAWFVSTQLAYSALSLDYYNAPPDQVDFDALWARDRARFLPSPVDPATHMYDSFNHLEGYSSSYYTYMYDLVIAADFFEQFDAHDMLAGETPMRYRRTVLEPGGSLPANELVRSFLGRPQSIGAIQRWMNEEFTATP